MERARRSFWGRIAPAAVLVLGCLFVAVAAYRLDGIYARDPGIFRSRQLAPRPMAVAHAVLVPVVEGARNVFAKSHFGRGVCARVDIQSLCESRPLPKTNEARRKVLEDQARRLFGRGSKDVTVTGWNERSRRIVAVSVAMYANEQATRRALRASHSRRGVQRARHAIRTPLARSAWTEGDRVLVGMLVTGPTRAAAAEELQASRRDVRAFVAASRFVSYELLALGPVLLLFAFVFGGRALAILAFGAVFAVFSLAVLAVLLAGLILIIPIALVRRRWGRERRRGRRRRLRLPFGGQRVAVAAGDAHVESLDGRIRSVAAENRSVMLVVAGLVGLAIALLTRELFPASLVWGSLLLVALYSPQRTGRGARWIMRGRTLVRALVLLTAVGVLCGLTPIGLLSSVGFQIVVVAAATVILVEQWRGLVAETPVGYAKWYEDIDARSSVFLAGVGLLTLGAAALFLASDGDTNASTHAGAKLFGLVGLLVASSMVAHARAARDSAARERARRRSTPPVLYLRSFGDDGLRVISPRLERRGLERFSWRRTELFEDVVARALGTIGPVVAIARPGTGQRDLGAARDSIIVEDWLEAVKSYMNEAVLITVVMGSSDGLVRELETLDELGLLDRVCVLVPPVDDDEIGKRLNVFSRQARFSRLWGSADGEGWRTQVVALATRHGDKVVLIASKRRASAYRAIAAYLST